jgi:crossover junction endodeoxyribonuclease RusA
MATTRMYRLPFPPSVNTYWRRGRTRGGKPITYLSAKAKQFRDEVCICVPHCEAMSGRLAVHIELTAPSRRKFDVDNFAKSTLDALAHAGVFHDDEQIDRLVVERLGVEPPGACDVTITELSAPAVERATN